MAGQIEDTPHYEPDLNAFEKQMKQFRHPEAPEHAEEKVLQRLSEAADEPEPGRTGANVASILRIAGLAALVLVALGFWLANPWRQDEQQQGVSAKAINVDAKNISVLHVYPASAKGPALAVVEAGNNSFLLLEIGEDLPEAAVTSQVGNSSQSRMWEQFATSVPDYYQQYRSGSLDISKSKGLSDLAGRGDLGVLALLNRILLEQPAAELAVQVRLILSGKSKLSSIQQLANIAGQRNLPTRAFAIRSLADYHVPLSFVVLRRIAGAKDDPHRLQAIQSLGTLRDTHAVELLEKVVEEYEATNPLRKEATKALRKIQDSKK